MWTLSLRECCTQFKWKWLWGKKFLGTHCRLILSRKRLIFAFRISRCVCVCFNVVSISMEMNSLPTLNWSPRLFELFTTRLQTLKKKQPKKHLNDNHLFYSAKNATRWSLIWICSVVHITLLIQHYNVISSFYDLITFPNNMQETVAICCCFRF